MIGALDVSRSAMPARSPTMVRMFSPYRDSGSMRPDHGRERFAVLREQLEGHRDRRRVRVADQDFLFEPEGAVGGAFGEQPGGEVGPAARAGAGTHKATAAHTPTAAVFTA